MNVSSLETLGNVFAEALCDVISVISGFSLNMKPCESGNNLDAVTGAMILDGAERGLIFISAEEDSVKTLCSYMTGVPESEVEKEDVYDAMCEVVNMTVGNAKLRLNDVDYMFRFFSPFIISGKDISVIPKKRVLFTSRALSCDRVSVNLKIMY